MRSALLASLFGVPAAVTATAPADPPIPVAEAQLRRVLASVSGGRLGAALDEVDGLIGRYPNFRLAHLVRGDLLLARAKPIGGFGNTGHAALERLEGLRAEALARVRGARAARRRRSASATSRPAYPAAGCPTSTAGARFRSTIPTNGTGVRPEQRARKRQYWVEEDGRCKIAYEANVGGSKLLLPESFPKDNKETDMNPTLKGARK